MASQLPIRWTNHALRRAEERFGDWSQIQTPDAIFQMVGKRKRDGEGFRVAFGEVVYRLKRLQTEIIVVTVFPKSMEPGFNFKPLPKGNRREKRKRNDYHNPSNIS